MKNQEVLSTYIALDLETTGLNPKQDRIIEIGAAQIVNGKVKDTFQTFVNPYKNLSEEVMQLTGITDAQLIGAPGIGDVIHDFLAFAGKEPVLGHQVIFDYSFLKRAVVNEGMEFERYGMDTLKLARTFMPANHKKNLASACQYFGLEQRANHRAFQDALAAYELYEEMKNRFAKREPSYFVAKPLFYKVKREQPAGKRQKEHLQDLLKYHKIVLSVQIDHMTRNEISRITDKIIAEYGRI